MSWVTLSIAQWALREKSRAVGRSAAVVRLAGVGALGDLLLQPPEAGQEAVHALDALVGPVAARARRAHEADVGASSVGAVALDVSAALTVLPFDEDIFAPSRVIIPWVKRLPNGSWTPRCPCRRAPS